MKKLCAILVMSISLVLVFSISAFAETDRVTAYVDTYGYGTWTIDDDYYYDNDDEEDDGSLDGVIVGMDIPIQRFKLGFEYEDGSPDDGDYVVLRDYTTLIIKCGFRVFGNDRVRIDLTLNNFENEYAETKATVSGIIFGADALWNISEQMFLQGSLGVSLNGEYEYDSDEEDAYITLCRIKFNYMFAENFGLGFGYRFNSILIDYADEVVTTTGGLTIGVTARF